MPNFRAKARAVDLLGKGQIADLPTAISELWKNGYDAYADTMEAYFYLKGYEDVENPFLVISDDGIGMSRQDILEKWIVLGTDSKAKENVDTKGIDTNGKEPRIKMGAKGIGRLSVAYLGSPMLMLTKKKNDELQALYIDWRVFEIHSLYLEEVNIEVKTISSIEFFQSMLNELKNRFTQNVPLKSPKQETLFGEQTLEGTIEEQKELKESIIVSAQSITTPSFFEEEIVKPLLHQDASGTKFIIFEPNEQLQGIVKNIKKRDEQIDEYSQSIFLTEVKSGLLGFYNIFKYPYSEVKYNTHFYICGQDGKYDLIGNEDFFEVKDFQTCDHSIIGKFNEYGEFEGIIRIFKTEYNFPQDYQFPEKEKERKKFSPGTFEIKVGYKQGLSKESLMGEEEGNRLEKKLKKFGGLYVYRDDFRVLPYGKPDQDFLGFEERRAKHAGTYFFDYGRLFGYVGINRNDNTKLIDKAGREGFTKNAEYRVFEEKLRIFFIYLAKTFYGTNATNRTKHQEVEKLVNTQRIENEEKEREKELRKQYTRDLETYEGKLSTLNQELTQLQAQLQSKVDNATTTYVEIEKLLKEYENCKINLGNLKPPQPVRFTPTDNQKKKLYAYQKNWEDSNKGLTGYNELIALAQAKLKEHELLKTYDNRYEFFRNHINTLVSEYISELNKFGTKYKKIFDEEKATQLKSLEERYWELKPQTAVEVSSQLTKLEIVFTGTTEHLKNRFIPFIKHLEGLDLNKVDEDALIHHFKETAKKIAEVHELAQLGMAVEIIDHEFNVLYSELAYSIKSFEKFVENVPQAQKNYKQMLTTFEHLEQNYKLITPLYRTSGKVRRKVYGKEFYEYLLLFFKDKILERHITFFATPEFLEQTFEVYESQFKAIFVNLMNNALFWTKDVKEKQIIMDYIEGKILFLNSGIPIEDYLLEEIFELFVSRRPKGRGIGLYISRKVLNEDSFNLYATNEPKFNYLQGACFVIEHIH